MLNIVYLYFRCPTSELQKLQKVEIEKHVFSLHMIPLTNSVTRPEVDVFYHLLIIIHIISTMFLLLVLRDK